jgi:hypothetical protein
MHFGAIAGLLLGMAACADHRDNANDNYHYDSGYRYENGDRIDQSGHRDVDWCAQHPDDEHCKP